MRSDGDALLRGRSRRLIRLQRRENVAFRIGDPLGDALITLMRDRKLMGGDLYVNARALEAEGVPEAVAFFRDVETVPSWLDFEQLHAGANLGRRNPIGLLFGMHSGLPFTYIDPSTAEVMASTGRFARQGDYTRRYWETATGFAGALDVEGMRPGGERWIEWVRIRFLHTMIRLGIVRGGKWSSWERATPISQLGLAGTSYIFGHHRVHIIRYFGGRATRREADSFALMWRWIARIQGANNQLLGRTEDEHFALQAANHQFLYAKTEAAQTLTRSVYYGAARMKLFPLSVRMHQVIVRDLLRPEYTETLPGHDVPGDLGLHRDIPAKLAADAFRSTLRGVSQVNRLRAVKYLADRRGQRFIDAVVDRGLDGVRAEYRGTPVAGLPTDR